MEENNNSPRTLKIELPVVDNSGHDEDDDEEEAPDQVADEGTEQEGGNLHLDGESIKAAENPSDEGQSQAQKEHQEESEPNLANPGETEQENKKNVINNEIGADIDENPQKDTHLIDGKENTTNFEDTTEVHGENLTEQKESHTNATNSQNRDKVNIKVTHSAGGATIVDHSDTETVVSYDPTGTHIIEYSENTSYLNVANELEIKKNEETDNPQSQNNPNGSEKSHLQSKTEDINKDPSDIHKHIERPSDTVPRPVKHQRKEKRTLTEEEEDLGIYEDTAEGDDLTDTELEVMKSKYRSAKLYKEYEKVLEEAEPKAEDKAPAKPIIEETITIKPLAEAVKRTKPTIKSAPKPLRDLNLRDFKDFRERLERGKTAVSCITDVFQESKNASRLALESREAMFRRAMTLLQARCTSMKQGLDPEDVTVPFGIQVPKYIYVTQEKPLPMEPLKAWRGYNGNVYFEPIRVNPLKSSVVPDSENQSPKDAGRLATKQSQRKSEPDKALVKAGTESRSESRQTVKSSGSVNVAANRPTTRQMAILDKQTVINRFNESLHEDIIWLEGQENTGSLAIRPRTQPNADRKKDLLYNKERLCKGSVAHRLYVEKNTSSKRPRFSVSGGKFTPPNSMSPLLRTQTQYSLSSHRLTTNSPDLYHLHDTKLPALDHIKASLKHSDGSREKTYTRPLTVTAEMKPFVKYSPDVVAKFAQQAM